MKKILLGCISLGILITIIIACTTEDSCECTATEYLTTSYKTSDKVTICHNDNTIEIDTSALQSHLDHGDTIGECETLGIDDINTNTYPYSTDCSDDGKVFINRNNKLTTIKCK